MYFDKFPLVTHKTLDGDLLLVTDIVRSIKIPDEVYLDQNLYQYYQCQDNETPEIISHKFYRSTAYHWVIMVLNQRFDVWSDYPKGDSVIRQICTDNYPSGVDGIHHYENSDGDIVDEFTVLKTPITNYEFEMSENEKKRIVKVLRQEYLSEFVTLYKELIGI